MKQTSTLLLLLILFSNMFGVIAHSQEWKDAAGEPVKRSTAVRVEICEQKFDVFAGGREGKNPRRVEVGETVVAIAKSGTEKWELLTPLPEVIPYTDASWEGYRARVAKIVFDHSVSQRSALRDKNSAYWATRRQVANAWLASTVGVPPTEQELRNFMSDSAANKRATLIDRLLEDSRWADHWMPFWQDLLVGRCKLAGHLKHVHCHQLSGF